MKNKKILELKNILEKYEIKEDYETLLKSIDSDFKNKKYGLIWEEHKEYIEDILEEKMPVLKELKNKNIDNKSDLNHILIEGENLLALEVLKRSRKKVDVIYIDPPYNTNNQFIYNDTIVDEEDAYRHSKWISFMNRRLRLARDIMSEDGVIFVSIDDVEVAQLKLLMDEVFGEKNNLSIIAVEISKTQGMKVRAAQKGGIVKNHEYILVYCKNRDLNKDRVPLYDNAEVYDNHFDIIYDGKKLMSLVDYIEEDKFVKNMFDEWGLKVSKKNIPILMKLNDNFYDYMTKDISKILYRKSMITSKEIQKLDIEEGKVLEYGKYLLIQNSKGTKEQLQSFDDTLKLTDEYNPRYGRATIRGALWKGFYSDMMNIASEGGVDFKNGKKPVRLIKQLFKWAGRPNGVYLDFFAGSGTSLQSIVELNNEDEGNRQCILITNNEVNESKTAQFLNNEYGKDFLLNSDGTLSKRNSENQEKFEEYINSIEFEEIKKDKKYKELGICRSITYKRISNVLSELEYSNNNLIYYEMDFLNKKEDYFNIEKEIFKFAKELIKMYHNTFCKKEEKKELIHFFNNEIDVFISTKPFIDDELVEYVNSNVRKKSVAYILKENLQDIRRRELKVDNIYPIPEKFINWFNK